VSIDLAFGLEARELANAVRTLCAAHHDEIVGADPIPPKLWRALADMGVLGLSTPDGGDAETVAAAFQELGRATVRGPLVGVLVAGRMLDDEQSGLIAGGELVPSVGTPPLMPWAPLAGVFIEIDADGAYLANVVGPIEAVDTLAGEPWGRCSLERVHPLTAWPEAKALADVGLAAYLVGAADMLMEGAVEYAQQRTQFGKAIGDFQAVAHPLADCTTRLTASGVLVRLAAHAIDTGDALAASRAATACASASAAALAAAYQAHQTFGAMGFTIEGPIGWTSRQIRQLTTAAVGQGGEILAPYGL
jgi:alkylation response protein AidB-like acyl-CoA dehydrogenase